MGLKERGFAKWILRTFPTAVRRVDPTYTSRFENVCIDVNPLLHNCLRKAESEPHFVKLLFATLHRCFRTTSPTRMIYFAVDGSPPLAKIKEQQRRRRNGALSRNGQVDMSQITPGTTFQLRVTEYLRYYAARWLAKDTRLEFIVSGAETPGEGEAKIMRHLRRHLKAKKSELFAIFSSDSDVLVQALLNPIPNIYVLQRDEDVMCYSIAHLREELGRAANVSRKEDLDRMIADFGLLVLMSGSDYMYKLGHCSYYKIWPIYKEFRQQAVAGSKWYCRYLLNHNADGFDVEVLRELLLRLKAAKSDALLQSDLSLSLEMLGHSRYTKVKDGLGILGLVRDDTRDYVQGLSEDSDSPAIDIEEDTETAGDLPLEEQKAADYTEHIPNYLQSLLWTHALFRTGHCSDVTFMPKRQYVLIEQILTYLTRDFSRKSISLPINREIKTIPTIIATFMLLGKDKEMLVPFSWRSAFVNESVCAMTHSFLNAVSFDNPTNHIKTLQNLIKEQIDITSPIIQLLYCDRRPWLLKSVYRPESLIWTEPLQPLGTSHPEIWENVTIDLEFIPASERVVNGRLTKPHLTRMIKNKIKLQHIHGRTTTSARAWPFFVRSGGTIDNQHERRQGLEKDVIVHTT